MSFEQLVARLAGGFCDPIDTETLRQTIRAVLPETALGELDGIKELPGFAGAAAETLRKAWRSGLCLSEIKVYHPRLAALEALERAVFERLPPAAKVPAQLVQLARERLAHAPAILGSVDIVGISELSPCWRDLLGELAQVVPVNWHAGPRPVPEWLAGTAVNVTTAESTSPAVSAVSAATEVHEAVEALRWARELVASGRARPEEIGIAATSPAAYDDTLLALRSDANLDLAFVHGIPITATRDGQCAAALAEAVLRGPSQARLRRLAQLATSPGTLLGRLPEGWLRVLPPDAPLATRAAWERLLRRLRPADWPDGKDHGSLLREAVERLLAGPDAAADAGEALLRGGALRIWRKALLIGHPAALDSTIATLRQDDGLEACRSVAWMPAAALAASPRPFVRLLGLTSSGWPRRISEDRLLPDHIVPSAQLEPLTVAMADRRDYETILATTVGEIVLSRARRDADGRLLGRSPMTRGQGETYLRRNRTPAHVMSETDRLVARPEEFAGSEIARSVAGCWSDWQSRALTGHDGLVRAEHPALLAALARVQSANSLALLLRNPLGFAWRYALRIETSEAPVEPIVLGPLQTGTLVHELLDETVRALEAAEGLATASPERVAHELREACGRVARRWEEERPTPPALVWRQTLADLSGVAAAALAAAQAPLEGQRSFTEVPFGGQEPQHDAAAPWDPSLPVEVPNTPFRVRGSIDRLDLSASGREARVIDYKTGRLPRDEVVLGGGKELQRCLYAYAVGVLIGEDVQVEAALDYVRAGERRPLPDPPATLAVLAEHLRAAYESLSAGRALPGPDAAGDYDDLAFALPANAANGYCSRKATAVEAALGPAALIWEEQ
ncbi:MAG TPA: PD-(D/E)XK nuclease family protein [Allosphingosinicella sp.]|nr:PD-(D/E)XK nuclease family protein [Allosphingosinicella sp.]